MRSSLLPLLVLFAMGCDDTKDDDSISSGGEAVEVGDDGGSGGGGSGSGGSGSGSCTVAVNATFPSAGQSDWFYQSSLEAELSQPDATAFITLRQGGSTVSGTTSLEDSDRLVRFTPSAPLQPNTNYEATISVCADTESYGLDFSTSELGTPLACDLVGRTFRSDLASARFTKPDPAVASLLFDSLENDFLLNIVDERGSNLELLAAPSDGFSDHQDYCMPSTDLGIASWSDPTFQTAPRNMTLWISGVELIVSNFSSTGTFAPDCSYTGGGRWTGELDARIIAPLVEDLLGEDDPDEICSLWTSFGLTCEPCASDGAAYCLPFELDQLSGVETGSGLSCVSLEDCHPACADSYCSNPDSGVCD